MPHSAIELFTSALNWLTRELQETDDPTVVVTHHAPASRSVADRFRRDLVSAAFASAHDEFVKRSRAKLWIHGHTHASFDYLCGNTRVLCNPLGYLGEQTGFRPDLVVEV